MSIWSSVGIGSGKEVTLHDHDGYGQRMETSAEIDVAIAWGWGNGIRLSVDNNGRFPDEGVIDRESAVLLRDRLTEAIDRLDSRGKRD